MQEKGFQHHPPSIDDITQRNIDTIARMERLAEHDRAWPARVADTVATFCGSWSFVILHALWFGLWIGLRVEAFPFGLLTMIVSLEAIFLSTIIMISQNRQSKISER